MQVYRTQLCIARSDMMAARSLACLAVGLMVVTMIYWGRAYEIFMTPDYKYTNKFK
jgi:hypothetical protein